MSRTGYDPGKLAFMIEWCERYGLTLQTKGEVGFGRPCVGILYGQTYVDFDYELHYSVDRGGIGLWNPPDAYHKHDCLAVLVHDDDYTKALDQLYEWVVWLIEHNVGVEIQSRKTYNQPGTPGAQLELVMHGAIQAKLKVME